jgi:nucleoside-diphosphate-sugar epimerase
VTEGHVVVTGAAGFVGRRLVARLLADPAFEDASVSVNDLVLGPTDDPRVRTVAGDLADAGVRDDLIDGRADIVFHLGGVLGGAAEADPARARAVNLDATLNLIDALHDASAPPRPSAPPRLVFASSIAVFGAPLPARIDDAARVAPTMIYGAHKAMAEIALEQASARGWIDGVALRLPGIVARAGADARLKSAFLNRLFEVFATGADLTLPVPADGTTWLLSVTACIDALIHAAKIRPDRLGARRALTLPAQNVRFADLVAELTRQHPASGGSIGYAPDPQLTAQFGSQPPLATPLADGLGFVHDGDLATLVARAMLDMRV